MSAETFDVVVAGGGPAGSTAASLVAMQGHRVLLVEKEVLPRHRVGESLLPSTVHGVCRMLGVTDELAETDFPVKRGATFQWGGRAEPWAFSFGASSRLTDATSFAYQADRARFDEILLKNAKRKGVVVREGCSVTAVVEEGDRVTGLRHTDPDGGEHEVGARFVIDASGHESPLSASVGGTRDRAGSFRGLALSGYFGNGCKRLPEPRSGDGLSVTFDGGWFWYVPLFGGLTSVGAVVSEERAEKLQDDREEAFKALIAECPAISDLLSEGMRVTAGKYGKLRVREDYVYHRTTFWRPGMLLVGDAACSVDPLFSSGVHLATYSALLAARSINSVLAGDVDEKTALTEFEARYRRELGAFSELLTTFHTMTGEEHPEPESFVDVAAGVSSGEWALAAQGGGAAAPGEPMFRGGLAVSPDGMKWLPAASKEREDAR
ncbi:tryptophan halogenase [Streptomyces toyocaensis]|uniref:StaK n=1 Tax=Streptomyces toyocaensis TaxID=55952 RepID=Q8KLM2_STRTO|nr:FAD-dependent oxidoreductase [Streptomyces toyocaensis]AAM80530.1 StaK [Streptomyces toyocaensis]KES08713.1 tryptophan halogenase [Streptomyces toyocaensis]